MTVSAKHIPEGFQTITPYATCPGAARLLDFLHRAFGAEETLRMTREDGSICHATTRIGDSMLELAEPAGEWKPMLATLHLYVKSVDETYQRAIGAGAQSLYEPREMEYGDREGGIQDPSGNQWYIATHQAGKHFIPEGLRSVTPGISLKDASGFLTFLVKAFGANVVEKNEAPSGTVGHAKVQIGDSMLECSEARGQWGPRPAAIHVYVPDVDTVFQQAITAGATSFCEPADQSYGERSGVVMDAWDNHWYIATHQKNMSKEELQRGTGQPAKAAS